MWGEVSNLVRTGWISRESLRGVEQKKLRLPLCTCGKRLDIPEVENDHEEACPFWSSVRQEWVDRIAQDNIENYPRFQNTFERHRRWPRLLYERYRPSPQLRSYARLTCALFESIRAVSGKPVILDSSKSPVRVFVLAMMPGIELRVVHLVRDGRGVAASRKKTFQRDLGAGIEWDHKGHPIWKSILRWININLVSEWVCSRLGPGRTIRLRYEDFVEDPRNALGKIGPLISLDLAQLANAAASEEPMQVEHNIGGNRMRKSGSITLRPDAGEWKNALSVKEQRLVWVSIGWLMRRYGYEK